ncbi:MAG: DUF11 domain-containing protein [Pseudomonadota bacterium]
MLEQGGNQNLLKSLSFLLGIAAFCCLAPKADAQVSGPYVATNSGTFANACPAGGPTLASPGDLRVAINVPDTFTVGDIDVGILVQHDFRRDSEVWIISPSGTRVELLAGPAPFAPSVNYNLRFDDAAGEVAEAGGSANSADHSTTTTPFQFSARKEAGTVGAGLSDFNGEPANGTWFVDYCDNFAADIGTALRTELFFSAAATPTESDLSVALAPASSSPTTGADTFFDVLVQNAGQLDATGVTLNVPLPSGLTFQSFQGPGSYNSITGVWNVGNLVANASAQLRIIASVESTGSYNLSAEVATSDQPDPDSTPGNIATNPTEDDGDTVTLTPQSPPAPLFCLGRPITPLVFRDPIPDSPGASVTNPQIGDVLRFVGVAPGADALIQVVAFNGTGAGLITIDNDGDGVGNNFQPTLAGGAGDVSVDLEIRIVTTGTSTPRTLDFAGSTIDVDGGAGIREYVEVSDNIVELALNGTSPPTPATRIISQFIDPNPPGAPQPPSAPSAPDRVRFEVESETQAPNGAISVDPAHIATAFFTDVSVFEYRVGKFGSALGAGGRLNSLAFNCPTITPSTTTPVDPEDFADAPASYGNPIHVIDAAVRIGPTNTDESGPGNSPTASSDAGDDGVTLPTNFMGGSATSVSVDVTGAGGLLQAFFDWNGDGDFEDADERPIVNLQDNGAGDTNNTVGTITFNVTPSTATITGNSFARFRWATSSVGLVDPAGNGEVEDYQITMTAIPSADLRLSLTATNTTPSPGDNIDIILTITNDGPEPATGVQALYQLPSGLTFVFDIDNGGSYNESTGVLTVPGNIASGASFTVVITANVGSSGIFDSQAEVTASTLFDPDSTPGNASSQPGEDDTAALGINPSFPPPPPVCPAGFTLVSQTSNANSLQVGTGILRPNNSLGALETAGSTPIVNTTTAELNDASDRLVLGLGVRVPENSAIFVSLGRDGGAANAGVNVSIGLSDSSAGPFTSVGVYGAGSGDIEPGPQDVLERVSVIVPSGGASFIEFISNTASDLHIDGVQYSEICVSSPDLQANKSIELFNPAGGSSADIFAIPGNDVTYTITVTNAGEGSVDADTIVLIDQLPSEIIFVNGDANGPGSGSDPVIFTENQPTGLTQPFSFANDVGFSNSTIRPATFSQCNYTPAVPFGDPDPDVRFVCINPKGTMGAASSATAPDPSFSVTFRARIR